MCWVLVAACGVFPCGAWTLSSCGRQAPELGASVAEVHGLSCSGSMYGLSSFSS